MKIKKAVIPAAGLGTRILPVTKAMPKEMLPIIDKPAIQYIVEEAASSGITEIMIITSRGKSILEDHFDRAPELEQKLLESGEAKKELYDSIMSMNSLANIYFVRQQEPKGLGHAILLAKVANGIGKRHVLRVHQELHRPTLGIAHETAVGVAVVLL